MAAIPVSGIPPANTVTSTAVHHADRLAEVAGLGQPRNRTLLAEAALDVCVVDHVMVIVGDVRIAMPISQQPQLDAARVLKVVRAVLTSSPPSRLARRAAGRAGIPAGLGRMA